MMEWLIENILFLPFLVGGIFIVTATIVLIFPPKKINYLYGYRTAASMRSQQRWDFAQRYSSIKMIQTGAALLAISFAGVIFPIDENLNVGIGIFLMLPACLFMFWSTERALRNKFPNE